MKKLWLILPVLAAGAGAWYFLSRPDADAAKETVSTIYPERGDLRRAISATGTVQPQNRLEIKPAIAGRIDEVLVREGDTVTRGQRLALMSSTDRAALLDAALMRDAATLAHWEEVYKPSPLLSPIEGTVISRAVEPGQTVTTGNAVLVLSDRLIVKAQVDETDIGSVRDEQEAYITLDAYPDKRIRGRIDHIAYESITVSNVTIYEVDILPQRVPEHFRAGMSANVEIVVAEVKDALTLPSAAVRPGRGGKGYVTVPGPGGEKQRLEVELGIEAEGKVQIISGLDEKQPVLATVSSEPRSSRRSSPSAGANPLMPGGGRRTGGGRR